MQNFKNYQDPSQRAEFILSLGIRAEEFQKLLDNNKLADIPIDDIEKWCNDFISIGSRVFTLRKVTRRGIEYIEPNYKEEYEKFENFETVHKDNKELLNLVLDKLIIIFWKVYPRIKKHYKW